MTPVVLKLFVRFVAILPPRKLARVFYTQSGYVVSRPVRQPRHTRRRRVGAEQAAHQAVDLLARDEHVALQAADRGTNRVAKPRWHADDRSPRAGGLADRAHEFAVRERLGTDRVDDVVLA